MARLVYSESSQPLVFLFDALRSTAVAFRSLKYFHQTHQIYEPRDLLWRTGLYILDAFYS
jgi:hypothetical protein